MVPAPVSPLAWGWLELVPEPGPVARELVPAALVAAPQARVVAGPESAPPPAVSVPVRVESTRATGSRGSGEKWPG